MSPAHDNVMVGAPAGTDMELAIVPVARENTNNDSHPSDPSGNADNAHSPPAVEHSHRTKLRTITVMVALCVSITYFSTTNSRKSKNYAYDHFSTLLITALNNTIVATAVPTICAELNSASGYAWISAVYLLATASAAPIWAKLSDIWGRKSILLTGVGLYFLTSIICAMAQSMRMLIIGRAFQGTAGGGLVQLVYITISDLFSMRSRTMYLGLLQLMWAVAGGIGPVVGGSLTEYIGWRWVFWINLPVSGTTFFLLMFLDVHNPKTKFIEGIKAIDWFGSFTLLGMMVMLLLGLNYGGATFPWNSSTVICLLVFGAFMSIFFVFSEKRLARHPLMPMGLFHSKSNVATLVVGFMHDFVVFATEFYLPLFFQAAKGASPLHSGILILPITLTQSLVALAASVVIYKTGRYLEFIWVGVTLLTVGNGLYINLNPGSTYASITAFEVVAAFGTGLLFQPPLIAIQAHVSPKDTATATATLGFARNIATSLAIVIGSVVFQTGMDIRAPDLVAAGLPKNVTQLLSGHSAGANVMLIESITDPVQKLAVNNAFAGSLKSLWILCTCMGACSIVASVFIRKRVLSTVHTEVKTGLKN
ncbi:hypothetical protein N0V90_002935 [Kalmusia sp. IMI 367209]|nr:hypothetical protein N0V90_002935 [Kalmusia sp. IMI 367209]